MKQSTPWNSYRQVATETATPGQLVLMLFDGAIRFLEQARTGFALDDPQESNQTVHNNIVRAQQIIQELNYSLNLNAGGEFAATLRRLYDYFDTRLHQSNRQKNEQGVQEVIARMTTLREAWAEMLRGDSKPDANRPSFESVAV